MAKFAKVTYGTKGDTEKYTYIVNDNVRTGDYLQPSVEHYISHKIYGTTGIVQQTAKQTSVNGVKMANEQKKYGKEKPNIVQAYTGKEVGATRERGEGGRYVDTQALKKPQKNAETGMYQAPPDSKFVETSYIKQTRQANVQAREQSAETFDSYAKNFIK